MTNGQEDAIAEGANGVPRRAAVPDFEVRGLTKVYHMGEVEVEGPGAIQVGGETVYPKSRTFIRSTLSDNPDLEATGYDRTLAALPAELRDAYRSITERRRTSGYESTRAMCLRWPWM